MLAIFDFIGSWLHIVIATILLVGYIMFIIGCLYVIFTMIIEFPDAFKDLVKICKAQKFNIRNFLEQIFVFIGAILIIALMVFFIVILAYMIPTAIELYNETYI